MALMKWRPFGGGLLDIQEEMNRMFDEFFSRKPERWSWGKNGGEWAPVVDITEKEEGFVVTAELPGLTQDDVHVSMTDNILTIRGEKKQEKRVEEANYHRLERSYGSFQRSFSLPSQVEASKIKATFKNGVLTVDLPKSEKARPKEIAIKVD